MENTNVEKKEKSKLKINKEMVTSAAIVACIAILFYFVVKNLHFVPSFVKGFATIISPFIIGGCLAFVLNPLMKFFEELLGHFIKKKKPIRPIALLLSLALIIGVIWVMINFIIPIIADGVGGLFSDIQVLFTGWERKIEKFIEDKKVSELISFLQLHNLRSSVMKIVGSAFNITQDLLSTILSTTGSIANGIINTILGIVVAIYLLLGKEGFTAQFRKLINAFLPQKAVAEVENFGKLANGIFGKFITGQLIDAGIVGVLCFFFVLIFTKAPFPYVLLIAVIIAMTNVIPYFGPFIGAIPSFIILLTVSLRDAIIFLLLILVIQQIDGNIINPRIMGESTGVAGIWVMFSVTVGGALFGIPGMFLGVPAFAIIYYYVRRFGEARLANKNLPVSTEDYLRKESSSQTIVAKTKTKEK